MTYEQNLRPLALKRYEGEEREDECGGGRQRSTTLFVVDELSWYLPKIGHVEEPV